MQRYLFSTLGTSKAALIGRFVRQSEHIDALSELAVAALASGDLQCSWLLADRRCRILPQPTALHHILRGEILHRLGDKLAALTAIRTALNLQPESRPALQRMIAWSDGEPQEAAARRLVAIDDDHASLKLALPVLARRGVKAVGGARIVDGQLRGWAAWSGSSDCAVNIAHDTDARCLTLIANPKHPLSNTLGAAADFLCSSPSMVGQWSGLTIGSASILALSRHFSGFEAVAGQERLRAEKAGDVSAIEASAITVIVPVYLDLLATRACLESLLISVQDSIYPVRIIAIDDASPDPAIGAYLATLATSSRIEVLTNSTNLGFVGTINRALNLVSGGDVVLLNSDTTLPLAAIDRLSTIARNDASIGTVTPLSNNGELMSMPIPYTPNPLPSISAVQAIDDVAQAVNRGVVVDVPSGIGFCLYVTRACLDAVGGLSARYERGYGEDEHLCLSAHAAGFRNICAASVYVGHAGSLSFGADKQALVQRNSHRINALFPTHQTKLDAFILADPLLPYRQAISRRLRDGCGGHLLVSGSASRAQAEQHLHRLAATGIIGTLLLASRTGVTLHAPDDRGDVYEFARLDGRQDCDTARLNSDLYARLRSLTPQRIAVFDPATHDRLGLDALDIPIDLHIADASMVRRRGAHDLQQLAKTAARFVDLLHRAESVIALDHAARAIVEQLVPDIGAKIKVGTGLTAAHTDVGRSLPLTGSAKRLGVFFVDETAQCRTLALAIATRLRGAAKSLPAVVHLGGTADDVSLLRDGDMMVTGRVQDQEFEKLIEFYGITHLFPIMSGAIFGAPVVTAALLCGRPMAQFDWQMGAAGQSASTNGQLMIDPTLSDREIADVISAWMGSGTAHQ